MTTHDPDDDPDLRRAFAALRADDAGRVPPFRAAAAAGPVRPRPAPWLGGLLAAGALVGAVLLTVRPGPAPVPSPPWPAEHWTAPTDFLLRTPGAEILETVPRIGAAAAFPTGPAAGRPLPKPRSPSP
jgi:hypothetical protein